MSVDAKAEIVIARPRSEVAAVMFDPKFDKSKLTRRIVSGMALEKTLDQLDASKSRFVWDGGAAK